MIRGIFIVGANGSGKTTLGRALAQLRGCRHIDIEDYSFEPFEAPYAKPREKEQVRMRILEEMKRHPDFVFAAVNGDLGPEISARCDCIVYLHAPLAVRMERVQRRSMAAFGERMLEGGDLYAQEQAFLRFVRSRTMEKTDRWAESMTCPVWHIDASLPAEQLARQIGERVEAENNGAELTF